MSVLRVFLYWIVFVLTFGLVRLSREDEDVPSYPTPDVGCGKAPCKGRVPLPKVPAEFESSEQHLRYELCYIDLLVRAQVCRWALMIAEHKPPDAWGMFTVNPAEVEAFLDSPFTSFGELPEAVRKASQHFERAALKLREKIRAARDATPSAVGLRLPQLQERLGLRESDLEVLLVVLLPTLDSRYRRLFAILQDDGTLTHPTAGFVLQILHPLLTVPEQARAAIDTDGPLWRQHILQAALEDDAPRPLLLQLLHLDERIVEFVLGDTAPSQPAEQQIVLQQGESSHFEQFDLDDRLTGVLSGPLPALSTDELILDAETKAKVERLAGVLSSAPAQNSVDTTPSIGSIFCYGPYGSGRLAIARALATAGGRPLLLANTAVALERPDRWRLIVDLCYREASLHKASLFWQQVDPLDQSDLPGQNIDYSLQKDYLLQKAAEERTVLTFLSADSAWDPKNRFDDRAFVRLSLAMPTVGVRRQLWKQLLPPVEDFLDLDEQRHASLADTLADAFQMTAGQMRDAIAAACALAIRDHADDPRIEVVHLEAGCRRQAGRRLNTLAIHIAPRNGLDFEDIVLPKAQKNQLEDLSKRIQNRSRVFDAYGFEQRYRLGRGLLTLFLGSSGTGKTMAAEILAARTVRDLYKVDMSQIVSKWVGETEKNLERVFSEATDSNAILFFDEADALFGKRGEVKDARDRWANQEVNFLLQRVEEYAGVVIMATNLRQNMDKAFMRRIHVIVDFPFPEASLRLQIWRKALRDEEQDALTEKAIGSDEVATRPIHLLTEKQLHFVAEKFVLSGGNIRNAVVDSAFRAFASGAAEKTEAKYGFDGSPESASNEQELPVSQQKGPPPITYENLLLSIAREYQKLGRPINRSDFGREDFDGIMDALYPQSRASSEGGPNDKTISQVA